MPTYDYRCDKCGKGFSVQMSMTDHDKGGITCPDCKDTGTVQLYSSFFAKTSKKS